ncbi:MAG: AAA family ATPase [Candidatus Pacearchaeota archaeon]|jgi:dephospho-CoA kinase
MIIGLTGRIAAGKEVVVNFFEELGFNHLTFSDAIRSEAKRRWINIDRKSLQDLGNLVRNQEGSGTWAIRLLKMMNNEDDYILDGIRNPGEIEELKKQKKHKFILLSIDAPQKERFERLIKRKKPSDPKTWDDFLDIDKRDLGEEDEQGQQVGKCMQLADYKIMNDSSFEEFLEKVDKFWNEIKKENVI